MDEKQAPQAGESRSGLLAWAWVLPILAAVFYTVSNACIRHLAEQGTDVYVTVAIRESVAFYFALPVFLWMAFTGRTKWPTWRVFLTFLGIGLLVQLVGNVLFFQALGVIGMAVSVAGNWTGVLLGSPVVAYLMLRERISLRILISLAVILLALAALTTGTRALEKAETRVSAGAASVAEDETLAAGEAVTPEISGELQRLGIQMLLLTVLVGLISAVSCTYIRYMAGAGYSPLLVVTMLPGTGAIFLSLVDFSQHGVQTYATLGPWDYFWAYTAGTANLLAFVALTLGLKYLSVVKVSILNVTQLALAPVVGFLIFRENINPGILIGIFLTILGIIIANTGSEEDALKTENASLQI